MKLPQGASLAISPAKICTKCGETKEADCFYNASKSKDGKREWCKKCSKEYNLDWNRTSGLLKRQLSNKDNLYNKRRDQTASDSVAERFAPTRQIDKKTNSVNHSIELISEDCYLLTFVRSTGISYSAYKTYKQTLAYCKKAGIPFQPCPI